ncbi:hypothetical protein Daura_17475 [Dactylosporangium aurantiacum]|uniref:Uncharacterized protein n=1 Tax=Dactylosporangium aurantiacum TaxID=35754 RepID=A0A9Q9IPT6_9ACTN|nr:hypothetical protein [Dactylosporangium aurantiacum]MDG6103300.1 hypothetical protein [Dactylosporangium aurantiacum]UWZ57800.1 hypothetical protein Daura_17475 [Dactylosporangium aurantiacum]
MRWFRRKRAEQPAVDPARQEALLADVRQRFGGHVPAPAHEQAAALAPLLRGDDGVAVATRIVHDTAEHAHAELRARAAARGLGLDRRNYRALYRQLGPDLQYRLADGGPPFHPYVHLPAALSAVDADVRRAMAVTDPNWLLIHTLELLDLTVSGWEFARVPVTADAAGLVSRLIAAATRMRLTEDEPPALPPGIREVMRTNRTLHVHDQTGAVVGTINVGAETRRSFLL